MSQSEHDALVRQRAFAFLDELCARHGDVLPWAVLSRGFDYEGRRVPLVSQQGIFKPAVLERVPLTIRTTPPKPGHPPPYDDQLGDDDLLRYRYRGTDPGHRENAGLREAHRRGIPLIYFHGVERGFYVPAYPVFIVGDDERALTFTVAVGNASFGTITPASAQPEAVSEPLRRYTTRVAVQRLHQADFRHRVLRAYRERCGICRLRHPELLDAAHIIPDGEPDGAPVVPNGLALCKLHHAAFDQNVLGIRPDLVIEVRADILREKDGPMLRHGLQDVHGWKLGTPRSAQAKPDPDRLRVRWERFREAS